MRGALAKDKIRLHLIRTDVLLYALAGFAPPPARDAGDRRGWLPEDDGLLLQRWRAGDPIDAIARKLKRTTRAINTRANLLKLDPRRKRWLPVEDREILRLRALGWRVKAIAHVIRREWSTVHDRIHALEGGAGIRKLRR